MTIQEKDAAYIASTYKRFPIAITGGQGSILTDENGKEYIDLATGIAVNTFGVNDSAWLNAIIAQAQQVQHTSNLFYSAPCANLAELLCQKTGMKKVFFSNSGAEANECAIKVARKYAQSKKGQDCYQIITLVNSFHGRTITTLAATGQDVFHQDFNPLTPGFLYANVDDVECIENYLKAGNVAAIMFELVQGEGGVVPLKQEFVDSLVKLAAQYDVLLIADEVQTGNGRTGELYAYMQYGFTPDIVTTAKGLGGGLPLGATLLGEKVKDTLTPGTHGSTFGGNPLSCAGAISILSRLDESVLADVKAKGEMVKQTLLGADGIEGVTGLGLMLGITTTRPAEEVVDECRDAGVIVIRAKQKVRLLPPLNIPDELLMKALAVIKEVCAR